MRILIAEDDEALAKFVRQGLESEHYSVTFLPTANRRGPQPPISSTTSSFST